MNTRQVTLRGLIVLLSGCLSLLPWSTTAIGDAATFAQFMLEQDLPMPDPAVPTDDPASCDDIGHEIEWSMLTESEWDNTSFLGACLARPISVSTGGLRLYVACRDLEDREMGDAATVPCGARFVNNGLGTWRIAPSQFELRETSGRPHRVVEHEGSSELVLAPGEQGVLEVSFATDTALTEPFFVVWWPEERLPPGAAQSLTVVIGA
jgi:hypothetical protein